MNIRELFPLGKAYGEAFCNRLEETNELVGNLQNGKHTFIVAPRRYGKSSLCEKALLNAKMPYQVIDFHLAINEKDIEKFILSAINRLIGKAIGRIDKYMNIIKNFVNHLQPKFIFKAKHLSLELTTEYQSNPAENIAEAILLLDNLLQNKKQRAALLLDEFQEVGAITKARGIEGAIRSAAQETQRLVFIFSGSNPHMLKNMFEDERRPLYKLCRKLLLSRIENKHYHEHLNKASQLMWQKPLTNEIFSLIMKLTERHPHYVNHLCDIIWSLQEIPPTLSIVNKAWHTVFEEERSDLIKDFLELSDNQKRIMRYIANYGGENLYSSEAAKIMDIPQGSVRGAIEQLLEKDFIENTQQGYNFIIPLYKILLNLKDS